MFGNFFFLILITSLIEDTPPDITIGILVKFDKSIVSFKLGPVFVPSLLISV